MLSVVVWRWGKKYSSEYVNRLHSMLSRHLHLPHQLYCITDDPTELSPAIIPVSMWPPEGLGRCRRLRMYDVSMKKYFGSRMLCLDIDCVITGDITPLVDRTDPLVMWRNVPDIKYVNGDWQPNGEDGIGPYNTSMVLMDTGYLPTIWPDYLWDRKAVEERAKKKGLWINLQRTRKNQDGEITGQWNEELASGDDDQAIVSLYARDLKPPIWLEKDGVYRWGRRGFSGKDLLPENAKIVFMNGSVNKMDESVPWIQEHWR